ncbi:hypothetical protein [Kaistella antarctica]|uniref:Uncharacterized protein n=1 Tax=Kaistella antarctica TaxID=266748 RepID=A0A3S4UN04_9FLAO|nr:hypothetical protein [Kaistella antarctica]KEY17969.1 hypothetical protein HY04_05425 [Kaistella antarctica]SEV81728.1 hypothetical protein SAMN05421765_0284 [Kaistella antarctica]VEI00408.1 Uncharacterised protein [Kaistella antarctica]
MEETKNNRIAISLVIGVITALIIAFISRDTKFYNNSTEILPGQWKSNKEYYKNRLSLTTDEVLKLWGKDDPKYTATQKQLEEGAVWLKNDAEIKLEALSKKHSYNYMFIFLSLIGGTAGGYLLLPMIEEKRKQKLNKDYAHSNRGN